MDGFFFSSATPLGKLIRDEARFFRRDIYISLMLQALAAPFSSETLPKTRNTKLLPGFRNRPRLHIVVRPWTGLTARIERYQLEIARCEV
jgi:hypothetical protein